MNNKDFNSFEKFIETIPLHNNFDEVCIDVNLLKSCNCKNHFNNFNDFNDFDELRNSIEKEDYIYLLQDRFKYYEFKIRKLFLFVKKCIEWIYYWKNKYHTLERILNENNIYLQEKV